jgi:hypothetical protein
MNTSARKKHAISTFGREVEASSRAQEQYSNAFQGHHIAASLTD